MNECIEFQRSINESVVLDDFMGYLVEKVPCSIHYKMHLWGYKGPDSSREGTNEIRGTIRRRGIGVSFSIPGSLADESAMSYLFTRMEITGIDGFMESPEGSRLAGDLEEATKRYFAQNTQDDEA